MVRIELENAKNNLGKHTRKPWQDSEINYTSDTFNMQIKTARLCFCSMPVPVNYTVALELHIH